MCELTASPLQCRVRNRSAGQVLGYRKAENTHPWPTLRILLYNCFGSSWLTTLRSFSMICASFIVLIRFSFSFGFSSAAAAAATHIVVRKDEPVLDGLLVLVPPLQMQPVLDHHGLELLPRHAAHVPVGLPRPRRRRRPLRKNPSRTSPRRCCKF